MRLEARDDLRRGRQDRLADVGLVGGHRCARWPADLGCRRVPQRSGRAPATSRHVAGVAAQVGEELARRDRPSCRLLCRRPATSGTAAGSIAMTEPIIPECFVPQYSAQNRWYVPGFGGLEPHRRVAAGHDVRLHAEGRHEEAVDDVLGGHDQLDRPADRHVQLVDLALARRGAGPSTSTACRRRRSPWRSSAARVHVEVELAPQTNITMAMASGMNVHVSSRTSEPWMGAPTSSTARRR